MNLLSPQEIAQAASAAGTKKAGMPVGRMVALAVMAGVYIGLGGNICTVASCDLSKYVGYGLSQVVAGSVFALGLTLVLVAGAELFTGNNMMLTVAALDGKVSWTAVVRAWVIVYAGNFVGALLLVWLVFNSGQWSSGGYLVGAKALATANAKVSLSFSQAFFRGIICNWMVCLAVWMSLAAKDVAGKIAGLFFPIMAFVAGGFEHSIANMYFVPLGISLSGVQEVVSASGLAGKLGNLTWGGFVANNLLPVTIGNIIGGALFVGALYWYAYLRGTPAQVQVAQAQPAQVQSAQTQAPASSR